MKKAKKMIAVLGFAGILGVASANTQPQSAVVAIAPSGGQVQPAGYVWDVAKVMTNPVVRYVQQLARNYGSPVPAMGVLAKSIGSDNKALDKSFD